MKKVFSEWKWLQVIEGLLLIGVGVLLAVLIWQNDAEIAIQSIVGYIIGSYIILNGLLFMVFSLLKKELKINSTLMIGIILIALGVFAIVVVAGVNTLVSETIIIFTAVFAFGLATYLIVHASRALHHNRKKKAKPIISYIVAAILIAAGVLVFIFMNETVAQKATICLVGIVISLSGIFVFVLMFKRIFKNKGIKPSEEQPSPEQQEKTQSSLNSAKESTKELELKDEVKEETPPELPPDDAPYVPEKEEIVDAEMIQD